MNLGKEIVLDRWAAGEGAGLIAKDFGRPRGYVYGIVFRARHKGDFRAVHHDEYAAGTEGWRNKYRRVGRGWALV
jgi:hypothetical protein